MPYTYTPRETIASHSDLAKLLLAQALSDKNTHKYSPIASLLTGLAGGWFRGQAGAEAAQNAKYRKEYLSNLPTDSAALGTYLLGSDDEKLQEAGLGLYAKMPTALETEKDRSTINYNNARADKARRPEGVKVGQSLEEARAAILRGDATPAQQKMYEDSLKLDPVEQLIRPGYGESVAPGVTTVPPPVTPGSAPTSMNAVPATPVKTVPIGPASPADAGALPDIPGATKDPRGPYTGPSPEGTIISNGIKKLIRRNGKWVPYP